MDVSVTGLLSGMYNAHFSPVVSLSYCQNLALMANCGDCCVLLLFCGRESLASRVPYCQAGYFREWLQLLI